MNEIVRNVAALGAKAKRLSDEKKWAEAAQAFEEQAREWIKAAGMATSPSARADRLAEFEKANDNARACMAKCAKAPGRGQNGGAPQIDVGEVAPATGGDTAASDDAGGCESLEELLAQLDSLIGLSKAKKQVYDMIAALKTWKEREANGLRNEAMSNHLVFAGNPGTGKTTVARLIAKIYRAMGLLKKGQLVETDRSGLVAGYVGQTATLTLEKVKEALGGVLFIDEAYALASKDGSKDFGKEAIDTLIKAMDDYRDNLVVIVAGYTENMKNFINTNPGMPSRLRTTISFEDYSADDLTKIFTLMAEKGEYSPSSDCIDAVRKYYEELLTAKPDNFGNARSVRNLFENAKINQARRNAAIEHPSIEELKLLTAQDISSAIAEERQSLGN